MWGGGVAEAGHRHGFAPEFFDRLKSVLALRHGMAVLDIGTGTGRLARELARRGCQVVGLDPMGASLAVGERGNATERVGVRYVAGRAERLPLRDGSVDLVACGNGWHLLDRDAAAAEAARVLRPDGALLIAHIDGHERPGGVVEATRHLLAGRREAGAFLPETFRYPDWAEGLVAHGFGAWECFGFTTILVFTHEEWAARIGRLGVVIEEVWLARALREHFAGPVLRVEHRVFALLARRG